MSSRLRSQAQTEALLDRGQLNRRFPYQNEILFSLVFEGVHICCISGQFFLLQLNKQRNKYLQRKRTNKFDFTPGIAVTEWESSNRCPPAFEGRHRLQLYCTEVSSIEDFRTKIKLFSLVFVSCPHWLHFRSNKQTNKLNKQTNKQTNKTKNYQVNNQRNKYIKEKKKQI